jgi:hypothetical protein
MAWIVFREVFKAHVGFSLPSSLLGYVPNVSSSSAVPTSYKYISTGNWGCGAFNGDGNSQTLPIPSLISVSNLFYLLLTVGLKSMLQWCAASMV